MDTLHRTQIYLRKNQALELRQYSSKIGKTVSDVIRDSIDYFLGLKGPHQKKAADWPKDPITKMIGKVKAKNRDLVGDIDSVVYND